MVQSNSQPPPNGSEGKDPPAPGGPRGRVPDPDFRCLRRGRGLRDGEAERPCPGHTWRPLWRRVKRGPRNAVLLPIVVLAVIVVILVGWEIGQRHLFPNPSVGLTHFLLTIRAVTITGTACGIVYALMRAQQRGVSQTATRLADLLEAYMVDPNTTEKFENRHLVHCREALRCEFEECPMYEAPGERCWQIMALPDRHDDRVAPAVELDKCHECEVFRQSAPDQLTALGEDINNLMFLLQTEGRRAEHLRGELVEREKMFAIGQLAAGLAHEVGNPLSSISSIVQMLKRAGTSGGMTDQLDLMESHIQRITTTVRQLSRLARRGGDRWSVTDIGRALEDTVKLVSFDERARNVKIEFTPPGPLPGTYGIAGQIEQVFLNLMLNALDAMPNGGTLGIEAHYAHGEIVVKIADSGCGIAPDAKSQIFNPFFTTKDPGQGTGLGLSVSYTVVQKLNGSIEFESVPDQGTVFTVTLPILDQPKAAPRPTT